jgi:hypothetical protein
MTDSEPGLQDKRGKDPERRRPAEFAIHLAILALVFSFAYFAYIGFSEREPLTVQSKAMLARSINLEQAVRPGVWPPGYPLVLLLGRSAGLPPKTTNLLLFFASCLLFGLLFKQIFPESRSPWPLVLFAACAFNYYNLAQFTSEILVVPLALCTSFLLLLYLRDRTFPLLVGLSLCCAAAFVSRYHALAWLLPLVGGHLFFPLRKINPRSLVHMAVFALIALVPIGFVMRANYRTNRHLTGMPRWHYETRRLPDKLGYYEESTRPQDNIRLIAQTLFVDFLSSRTVATHEVNASVYQPSGLEWGIALILAMAAGIAAFYFFRGHCRLKHPPGQGRKVTKNKEPGAFLPALFFAGYILITFILWSVGNNDPIYTRFLYPSYPFLILWGFAGYFFVKKESSSALASLPFLLSYLAIVAINLCKIVPYLK